MPRPAQARRVQAARRGDEGSVLHLAGALPLLAALALAAAAALAG